MAITFPVRAAATPGIEESLLVWIPGITPSGLLFDTGNRFPAWKGNLMVGSIDPYQLFRIFHELVGAMLDDRDVVARQAANRVVYMLDQCHNIEPKIPAMIRSVMTLQETFARALLVDTPALQAAQERGDVLEANRLLQDAFQMDVRPMLAELRTEQGLPADPYRAFLDSGEAEAREAARVGGVAASW